MQGRRIYYNTTDDILGFANGDYGFDPKTNTWFARAPIGHLSDLSNHDVVEHEDGTITVSPSILVSGYDEDKKEKTVWHGYLERGIWREV